MLVVFPGAVEVTPGATEKEPAGAPLRYCWPRGVREMTFELFWMRALRGLTWRRPEGEEGRREGRLAG